ncbi:RES family NAD+ phosphorylase [Arthrobacter alpinus]|nr:RES family NAD+ phosphorylase [Arthrobacter alpinus]
MAYDGEHPRGAWWFSSIAPGGIVGGRFDLDMPRGTCYLATDIQTALRERVGTHISQANLVPEAVVNRMEVVNLRLPQQARLADTSHESAANWGAIRELGASYGDYSRTALWATAFLQDGFSGLLYESRLTSIAVASAIALFDKCEQRDWPEGPRISGAEAFKAASIDHLIARIPSSSSPTVKLVQTPAKKIQKQY